VVARFLGMILNGNVMIVELDGIRNIHVETFAYSNSANILDISEKKYPMTIPTTMQTAVQNERYLLKKSNSLW